MIVDASPPLVCIGLEEDYLGAVLVYGGEVLDECPVRPRAMWRPAHALLLRSAYRVHRRGEDVTHSAVRDELARADDVPKHMVRDAHEIWQHVDYSWMPVEDTAAELTALARDRAARDAALAAVRAIEAREHGPALERLREAHSRLQDDGRPTGPNTGREGASDLRSRGSGRREAVAGATHAPHGHRRKDGPRTGGRPTAPTCS